MRIRIQQFARAAASWILSGSGGSSFTIVPCLAENLLCDLYIIKGDRTIPHHLHFFVALASYHHYVPRTGFMNRESYGRFAIRLRLIFRSRALQSDHGIVDNCERIFAARVIGGQHHEITAPAAAARMLYTFTFPIRGENSGIVPSGVIRSSRVPRGVISTFSAWKSPLASP